MEKIKLIKEYYGFTTEQAKKYLNSFTKKGQEKVIKEIQKYFKNQAVKSFYND